MSDSPTWSDGLMSALLNPGVQALAGAAGGFAQAAMPSRLPVPTGAALGMGAAGALQGVQNAARGQLAQQQIQAAQMQNQATASGLPATLASNALRTRMLQDPTLLNQMMGGQQAPSPSATAGGVPTPGSSTVPAPTASPSVTKNAFSSLPDDTTRTLAANAAMRAGLPQEAWPAWMATVHNESGWNINAPDNQDANGSYDIGPGQINSRTARTLGYTPDQLRDPATNLLASAKYFGQQWTAGGADPAKAMAGYNTGDPTKADPDYVSKGMTQLGNWGYAGAAPTQTGPDGQPVTPAGAGTIAQGYIQQANQLERQQSIAKFLGLPAPPGDPAVLRTMAGKYTDLALAGPTAAAVAQNQNIVIRPGGAARIQTPDGPQWTKLPDRIELTDQNTGNKTWAYATPPLVIGNHEVEPGQLSPITGTNGAPAIAESPAAVAAIHARSQVMSSAGIAPAMPGVPAPPVATPAVSVPVPTPPAVAGGAVPPAVPSPGAPAAATPPPAVQNDIQHIAPGITARSVAAGTAYTNTQKPQQEQFEKDSHDVDEITDEANALQGNMSRFYEARDLINQIPQTGSGGQYRANIANFVQTYIKPLPGVGDAADQFLHQMGNLPDASLSQQLFKLTTQAAGQQEKSVVGSRGGIGLTNLFVRANPGLDTLPDANKMMVNFLLAQHQQQLDYARGAQAHFAANSTPYLNGEQGYSDPLANFDRQWNSQDNQKVYVAATNALSGRPFADWTKLLGQDVNAPATQAAIKSTLGVVQRIDPTAQIMWADGQPHVFRAPPAAAVAGGVNAP